MSRYPHNLRPKRKIGQQFLSKILIHTNTHHLLSVHEPTTKKKARPKRPSP
jgi:hypothetical protein